MTDTDIRNDATYKESVRSEWAAAAPGWQRWIDVVESPAGGQALTRVLLDASGVTAGDDVLDVGSGFGEPGLSAAAIVGTAGHVTCLDISGDMLAFAEQRARNAGLANVRFVEGDVEAIDLGASTFDVVLSRMMLMYATEPRSTLRALWQALRPGGRLAVAVWATPDQVAFATPVPLIADIAGIELAAEGPGPFALGAPGALDAVVRDAGFVDIRSGTAVAIFETPDAEACTQWLRDVAPPITELVAGQPEAIQEEVWRRVTAEWARYTDDGGRVRLPNTAVWAAGTKPA